MAAQKLIDKQWTTAPSALKATTDRLSDTPPTCRNVAPLLGEHTVDASHGIGYSDDNVQKLEVDGVVRVN